MSDIRVSSVLEGFGNVSEEQLSKARHHIDPDLLKEKDLGDKLTTLRKITKQTNGNLAAILKENKRTFESWVSGRYVPEGDKLHKVNNILLAMGLEYIKEVYSDRKPGNVYTGFPTLFKLLDFNDAVTLLVSFFNEQGKNIDYDSGNITG